VLELVVNVAWTLNFPDEVEFVQKFLSIKSNFVVLIVVTLRANPLP
jgi:hypothetical protein